MKLSKTQLIMAGVVLLIILVGALIALGIIPGLRQANTNPNAIQGDLTIWGVFDDEVAVSDSLLAEFAEDYPGVSVSYRKLDIRTYETELINALASGTGPDIFYIHNSWLPKHYNKLFPRDPKQFTVVNYGELFPQVVVKDFVKDGAVYAMPLYLDTLVMLYNKNMFDAAGIAQVPKTWEEFEKLIPLLRITDKTGRITQAAAAIGTSNKNINNANDLLYQMMLQNGVKMTNPENTEAAFPYSGQSTLDYFLSFANPRSPNYTWDRTQHYSLDAFAEETVAMLFNYGYQLNELKSKNPFLNIGVAPMLQLNLQKATTYANYWGMGVSATSKSKDLAWTFVNFAATDGTANAKYLNATRRSPALRSIIAAALNDVEAGIFSRQALMSTSWYQKDGPAAAEIFSRMLESVSSGQLSSSRGLQQAAQQITEILRR